MKILSITGTKGKTTITRALSYVLKKAGNTTLRVDTDGHYINEIQESTLEDSRNLFVKAPTVCPGKYLITMKNNFPDFIAILETAIGSNGTHGLGYGFHQVGIFSNVFEDHMGIGNLKTRKDLAQAKSFIFRQMDEGGFAIFNADDKYVCSQLKELPKDKKIKLLPVGIKFEHFGVHSHLNKNGKVVAIEGNNIVIKSGEKIKKIIDVGDIPWTFNGLFEPSVYNLMFIVAALYAVNGGKMPRKEIEILKGYKMEKEGGRLTMFKNANNVRILVDYAHEKASLKKIAELGNKLKENELYGIVRLAPDRTNKMIRETGHAIANRFDHLVVYDKIDGVLRGTYHGKNFRITRKVGEVSKIFFNGIRERKKKGTVSRIIFEGEAIKEVSRRAKAGDVVIVICNDDHKRTIGFIKKYFKAKEN